MCTSMSISVLEVKLWLFTAGPACCDAAADDGKPKGFSSAGVLGSGMLSAMVPGICMGDSCTVTSACAWLSAWPFSCTAFAGPALA